MKVIGLVGQIASGKGTVAGNLAQEGYEVVTLSQFIKAEVRQRGLEVNREILQKVGDELRAEFGGGILVKMAIANGEGNGVRKLAIDGLRSVGEIMELRKFGGMIIGIVAESEMRLKWYLDRGRDGDSPSVDDFRRISERENLGATEWEMNIEKCLELADFTIQNEGSLEDLEPKMRAIMALIEGGSRGIERN